MLIIEEKKDSKEKKKKPQKLSNIRNRAEWLNRYRSQKLTKSTPRCGVVVGYIYEVKTKILFAGWFTRLVIHQINIY